MVRSPLSNSRAPKSALGHLRAPQGRTGRLICLAAAATLAAAACTPGGASPMGGGSRSGDDPLVTKALPPDVPGLTSLADGAAIPPELIPGYLPPTDMGGGRFSRPLKDTNGTIEWWVTGQNDPSVEINWGDPAAYSDVPGVFTFRGANYRSSPAYGTPTVTQKQLQIEWTHPIGRVEAYDSIWPGAGWTGQPLLVNWPAATKQAMGFPDSLVAQDDFVEVIYPVFDGHVYRLDMATGQPTKPAMQGTCPFKGTGSVDPRGYPLLYAGQGLPDINGEDCPWRYRVFDLIQNRQVTTWNGSDPDAPRSGWGAFDSSALVDKTSGYLLETGENGLIYKVALAAQFDAAAGSVSVTPSFAKLAYKTSLSTRMGIESSPAAYRNLLFTQDNDGILAAWDAITLTNIWARAVGDDADATILVEPKIGEVGAYLYVGNEVDHRGEASATNLRKIDALTGEQLWQYDVPTIYDEVTNGGLVASPMLGAGQAAGLVIFNVAKTGGFSGLLVALDTVTGEVRWSRTLPNYSWSSPLGIMADDGTQYGILCDAAGVMHLFDPATGTDFDTLAIGGNTEASPAAFGDMIVVANYSQKIYGIRLT